MQWRKTCFITFEHNHVTSESNSLLVGTFFSSRQTLKEIWFELFQTFWIGVSLVREEVGFSCLRSSKNLSHQDSSIHLPVWDTLGSNIAWIFEIALEAKNKHLRGNIMILYACPMGSGRWQLSCSSRGKNYLTWYKNKEDSASNVA